MDYKQSTGNNRPIIKIQKNKIDFIIEYLVIAILLFIWIYAAINFSNLPETIPTHFNTNGNIDGYGPKYTLFLCPAIISLVVLLFSLLSKYPHKFNYIVAITEYNAERQYRLTLRIMRIISMNLTILFAFITIKVVNGATQKTSTLDWWFIPVLEISVISPVVYMIIASTSPKIKKTKI